MKVLFDNAQIVVIERFKSTIAAARAHTFHDQLVNTNQCCYAKDLSEELETSPSSTFEPLLTLEAEDMVLLTNSRRDKNMQNIMLGLLGLIRFPSVKYATLFTFLLILMVRFNFEFILSSRLSFEENAAVSTSTCPNLDLQQTCSKCPMMIINIEKINHLSIFDYHWSVLGTSDDCKLPQTKTHDRSY